MLALGLKDWLLKKPFRKFDQVAVEELGVQAIVTVASIKSAVAKVAKIDEDAKKEKEKERKAEEEKKEKERKAEEEKREGEGGEQGGEKGKPRRQAAGEA